MDTDLIPDGSAVYQQSGIDELIATLRYRLAWAIWTGDHATGAAARSKEFKAAYAIAEDLAVVIRALGDNGKTITDAYRPQGQLPLASGSVAGARAWLGLDGDRLLGKA